MCWKGTPRSAIKIRGCHTGQEGRDAQGSPIPLPCVPEELTLADVSCFVLCVFFITGLVSTHPSEFFPVVMTMK